METHRGLPLGLAKSEQVWPNYTFLERLLLTLVLTISSLRCAAVPFWRRPTQACRESQVSPLGEYEPQRLVRRHPWQHGMDFVGTLAQGNCGRLPLSRSVLVNALLSCRRQVVGGVRHDCRPNSLLHPPVHSYRPERRGFSPP